MIGVVIGVFGAAAADPKPSPSPSASTRFGVPLLPAGAPRYDDADLLADVLRVADLVVIGTPGKDQLSIDSILAGTPLPALQPRSNFVAIAGPRFQPGTGVWLLLSTPAGYYALNPHASALPVADGPARAARIPTPRPAVVAHFAGDLALHLLEDGRPTLLLGFDRGGALVRVRRAPSSGPGLDLDLVDGRLRSFAHLRAGLRHGRQRTWDDGRLALDARYQDNLRLPVVRAPRDRAATRPVAASGEVVTLTRGEHGNRYEVPAALRARLRVGMTAATVARLLGVDFSLPDGIDIVNVTCETDLHVGFARGRIASLEQRQNGRHCSALE